MGDHTADLGAGWAQTYRSALVYASKVLDPPEP